MTLLNKENREQRKKIGLFTDIHWGKGRDDATKLKILEDVVDWSISEFKKHGVHTVIFLGDWFDNRNSLNVNTLAVAYNNLKKICQAFPEVIMLIGNHDCHLKNSTKIHSLIQYTEIDNLTIVEESQELALASNKTALLCPWQWDINSAKGNKYSYLFGHFEMNGAALVGSISSGANYNMNQLPKYAPLSFAGHYHINKTYDFGISGKVVAIGSPCQLDWGDYANDKGLYIIDTVLNDYVFVKNNVSPVYCRYYLSELKDGTSTLDSNVIKNNIVKLIVDCEYEYAEVTKILADIGTLSPNRLESPDFLYSFSKGLISEATDADENVNISKLEYIKDYIEKLTIPTEQVVDREELKTLIEKYYIAAELELKTIDGKSRIAFKRITAENFMSIGPKTVFDYTKHNGLNYVYGVNKDLEGLANGSGKSTVISSLLVFALYGRTIKDTKNKFIPNRVYAGSKTPTYVKIEFSINTDEYIIETTLAPKSGAASLKLTRNGIDETKSTLALTRDYIENEILKCTYELFKNSIVLTASDTMTFFSMKKAQRREYIEGVFKLMVFGEMLKKIRIDSNSLEKTAISLQRDIKAYNDNLEEYNKKQTLFDEEKTLNITRLNTEIKIKESQISSINTELDPAIKDKKDQLEKIDKLKEKEHEFAENIRKFEEIETIKSTIAQLKAKDSAFAQDTKNTILTLENEILEITEKIKSTNISLDKTVEEHKNRIDALPTLKNDEKLITEHLALLTETEATYNTISEYNTKEVAFTNEKHEAEAKLEEKIKELTLQIDKNKIELDPDIEDKKQKVSKLDELKLKERKIYEETLNIDAKLKEIDTHISHVDASVKKHENVIGIVCDTCKDKLKTELSINTAIETKNSHLENRKTLIEKQTKLNSAYLKLVETIKVLESYKVDIDEATVKYEFSQKKLDKLNQELTHANEILRIERKKQSPYIDFIAKANIKLEKLIETIKNDISSEFSIDDITSTITTLAVSKGKLKTDISTLEALKLQVDTKVKEIEKNIQNVEIFNRDIANLTKNIAVANAKTSPYIELIAQSEHQLLTALKLMQCNLDEFELKKNEAITKHTKVKTAISTLEEYKAVVADAINAVNENIKRKDLYNTDIAMLNKQIVDETTRKSQFSELIVKATNQIHNTRKSIKDYEKQKINLDILEHVVSEDGAKKTLIKDLVGIINSLEQKYLAELGSQYTCVFDENFDETFLTNTGPCEFSNFSSGERQRISLSVMLSFKDVQNSNIDSNVLVFDELLDGGIDSYAFKAFVNILKRQTIEKNQLIFLVSHREVASDEDFDNIIEITKKDSISTITKDLQLGIS